MIVYLVSIYNKPNFSIIDNIIVGIMTWRETLVRDDPLARYDCPNEHNRFYCYLELCYYILIFVCFATHYWIIRFMTAPIGIHYQEYTFIC